MNGLKRSSPARHYFFSLSKELFKKAEAEQKGIENVLFDEKLVRLF